MSTSKAIGQQLDAFICRYEGWDPSHAIPEEDRNRLHQLVEAYRQALMIEYPLAADGVMPSRQMEAEGLTSRAIFLCGYMKTGTTLLQQLLDGHPALLVLPGDASLANYIAHSGSLSQLRESLLMLAFYRLVVPCGIERPNWYFGHSDELYARFLCLFKQFSESASTPLQLVVSLIKSNYCTNPVCSSRTRMWVEKTPGNEQRAREILDMFPDARFIHILRSPFETMASLKRLALKRGWGWNVDAYLEAYAASMKAGFNNQREFGETRYRMVDYHQLTTDTIRTMESVASWMGIDWDPSLVIPTVGGENAKANSMFIERKEEGRVYTNASPWKSVLTNEEVTAIRVRMHGFLRSKFMVPSDDASHRVFLASVGPYLVRRGRHVMRSMISRCVNLWDRKKGSHA